MKKSLAILLALIMMLTMVPAFAEGEVAQIGGTKYATLDEAIEKAADGATIVLLADCESDGFTIDGKTITISGDISENNRRQHTVTLKGDDVLGSGKGNIVLKNAGKLILNNCTFKTNRKITLYADSALDCTNIRLEMDANKEKFSDKPEGDIYYDGAIEMERRPCRITFNRCSVLIQNYLGNAIRWDEETWGYEYHIKFTASDFTATKCRSGFTGKLWVDVDNSTINVVDNYGNGSNGSRYTINNDSVVNFNNNGKHGLSAWTLKINDSTVNAIGNGGDGIVANQTDINATSHVLVKENAKRSFEGTDPDNDKEVQAAFHVYKGDGHLKVAKGADFRVIDNYASGIKIENATETLELGSGTIMNNHARGGYSEYGGGIYNVGGTATIDPSVVIYNNHAVKAGDDIYSTRKITFGGVGSDWWLDGAPDCDDKIHKIDGWHDDAEENRWQAHKDNEENHIVAVDPNNILTDNVAVKAAHGANAAEPTPVPTPGDSGYYYPTTTPVPVIVIPPKTGDMTIWQSILHFLGIR